MSKAQMTRKEWVQVVHKIAYPVISAMAEDRLKEVLPLKEGQKKSGFAYLEALGRTLMGIAPWLELDENEIEDQEERNLQAQYRELTRRAIANATNPESKDYCVWNPTGDYLQPCQAVVDAAFFASGLLKAPHQLWELQPQPVKDNILHSLDLARKMRPWRNNWLLFSATIEACRYKLSGVGDGMRVEYALNEHMRWYVGDGMYKDGENFAMDYYNSFVIQPMLEEVSRETIELLGHSRYCERIVKALQRYAELQERMIAPDGTYPYIGRSIAYRMAAFQGLAHCVYKEQLPKEITSGQVRCALDKVIKKILEAPGMFDEEGFLTRGLYGKQESLANDYINTGSVYLCLGVFLPLGLSAKSDFWQAADEKTTWEKVWSGEEVGLDKALEHR